MGAMATPEPRRDSAAAVADRTVHTHLVGSLPFRDADEAMGESLARLGDSVLLLSDGETGERGSFVAHLPALLERNPALVRVSQRNGLVPGQRRLPAFRIARGRRLAFEPGALGYARAWQASLPLFRALRERVGRPDLRYMMAMGSPLSIALPFFTKPRGVMRALGPVERALGAEVALALDGGRDVLAVQLDAAFDQIIVANMFQGPRRPVASLLARWFAGTLAAVARGIPPDVPVGVHLCLGNPGNQRVVTPRSTAPIVLMANTLARRWPRNRPLDYLHIPIVDSSDDAYYVPLRRLRLDPRTRLIAGLVYEDGHAANLARLSAATDRLGYIPDLACACGMGRRTPEVGRALLDEMAMLARR
jgi:hypothetical protein